MNSLKFILSFDFTPAILIIAMESLFKRKITVHFVVRNVLPQYTKHFLQILRIYVPLPMQLDLKCVLLAVEHGEGIDQVVFCLFSIHTGVLDYVDEFVELESRFAVGELRLFGFPVLVRHHYGAVSKVLFFR